MKNKVKLKEILASHIIIAILIAIYYWCWARNDWKGYYVTIQNTIGIFAFLFCMIPIIVFKTQGENFCNKSSKLLFVPSPNLTELVLVINAESFTIREFKFILLTSIIYNNCKP